MFALRPKLPVTATQQEWIEGSFDRLIELFGSERVRNAPLVLPNEQFFPRKWEQTEEWARYAFDRVCEIMEVERSRVDLEFIEDPWAHLRRNGVPLGSTHGAAGTHQQIEVEGGPDRALISLKDSLIAEPEKMVATMSHELAHVLLLGDRKIARDMDRMEPFTDLTTVFCGFGVFTANAAFVFNGRLHGWQQSNLGYLSQREFAYALARFAWERGERNPAWTQELTTNVRHFMRAALSCFKASGRA